MSFAEAACLPTAWLTAYRMLFTQGNLKPGDTVLVQGAGGGVATALITLARAGGLTVLATSRDEAKRARALDANIAFVCAAATTATFFVLSARRTLDKHRWLLKVAVWSIPLPWIAAECGWIVAELGRQPWAVEGVLPTAVAVSSAPALSAPRFSESSKS